MMKPKAVALMFAMAATSACTDGGTSLIILQNQVPQAGCVVPTTAGSFRPIGTIDVAADSGYLFTPLVRSLVAEPEADGESPHIVFVEGAEVNLSFQEGLFSEAEQASLSESGLTSFTLPFAGAVEPGADTSFAFEVINKQMLDTMAGKLGAGDKAVVNAEVKIFGSLDGGSIETQPFTYPIQVCDGCLRVNRGLCSSLSPDFQPQTGGVCQLYQDDAVDCCEDGGGALICPAVPPADEV